MFFRTWHRLHVSPRLALVTCFPALGTGCIVSRAWNRLHSFPRLAPVAWLPALGTGYLCSPAWHWLHVFPRLVPVACFSALETGYTFFLGSGCLSSHFFKRNFSGYTMPH